MEMKTGCINSLTGNQLNGAFFVALFALFIPAMLFLYREYVRFLPVIPFGEQGQSFNAVEIDGNIGKGIYFLPVGKGLNDLLSILHISSASSKTGIHGPAHRELLEDGAKITIFRRDEQLEISMGRMAASTRLALDMPIDLNRAFPEDLILVPGIGEKTAQKIIEERGKRGKFRKLDELMKIKGIKQRRLEKLRPYLFVENS